MVKEKETEGKGGGRQEHLGSSEKSEKHAPIGGGQFSLLFL